MGTGVMQLDFRVDGLTEHTLRRRRASKISASVVGWAAAGIAVLYSINYPGRITIDPPVSGGRTSDRIITVSGTVENPNVGAITLTVNRTPRTVPVANGRFTSTVPLVSGGNTIRASIGGVAANVTGGSALINVTAAIPPADVWIELAWDGPGDVDLHLYLPNGEHCFYKNMKTAAGAVLDIDNTKSNGPEHITMEKAIPGEYQVHVVYFKSVADRLRPVNWWVTVRHEDVDVERTFSGTLHAEREDQTVYTFTRQ